MHWVFHNFSTASCSFTMESMVWAWNICLRKNRPEARVQNCGLLKHQAIKDIKPGFIVSRWGQNPIKPGSRKGSSGWILIPDLPGHSRSDVIGVTPRPLAIIGHVMAICTPSNPSQIFSNHLYKMSWSPSETISNFIFIWENYIHAPHPGMAWTNCASNDCMFWSCIF